MLWRGDRTGHARRQPPRTPPLTQALRFQMIEFSLASRRDALAGIVSFLQTNVQDRVLHLLGGDKELALGGEEPLRLVR